MKRVIVLLLLAAAAQGCGDTGYAAGDPPGLEGDATGPDYGDDSGGAAESPDSGVQTAAPTEDFADCTKGCTYRLASFAPEGGALIATDPSGAGIAQSQTPFAGPASTDGKFTLHMGTPAGEEQ